MHQHTIFVCMLKCTQLASIIFVTPRAVDPLRKGMHWDHKLGNNYDRNLEGKLLDLDVVVGIGTGIIWWHLGEAASISADVVGDEILLVEALGSTSPSISVIPAIGTEGGKEGKDKVVDRWRGTKVEHEDAVWCWVPITSTSNNFAAGEPRRANSSGCIASMWRSSAKLWMWFANLIFCRAWVKTKAMMTA